jgi:hypothetical protein
MMPPYPTRLSRFQVLKISLALAALFYMWVEDLCHDVWHELWHLTSGSERMFRR